MKARRSLCGPGKRQSSSWLPGAIGLEPADLAGAIAGNGCEQLAVLVDDPQSGITGLNGDGLPAWLKPTWMRWRATWMPPRLDTFRWMVRSAGGSGAGPASRTPWSLCRWPGGMGQGRLRNKTPSWVMMCMTWPSRRIFTRCPASGEPTWMTWLPRVMSPAALTSRCTSTQPQPVVETDDRA